MSGCSYHNYKATIGSRSATDEDASLTGIDAKLERLVQATIAKRDAELELKRIVAQVTSKPTVQNEKKEG